MIVNIHEALSNAILVCISTNHIPLTVGLWIFVSLGFTQILMENIEELCSTVKDCLQFFVKNKFCMLNTPNMPR